MPPAAHTRPESRFAKIAKTHRARDRSLLAASHSRTGVAHSALALAQEQHSALAQESPRRGHAEGNAEAAAFSYAWFSGSAGCRDGPNTNTTTTYLFGVGPPGLEGPVRQPSSNPPRAGPAGNASFAVCL